MRERIADDAYDTIEAVPLLGALLGGGVKLRGTVWEPHAGAGRLVRALTDTGHRVIATDIRPRSDGVGEADFLSLGSTPVGVGSIVMNPPYQNIDDHIAHALEISRVSNGMVALLARSELSHAQKRARFFKSHPAFDRRIELLWRPRWFEGPGNSPRHNFTWFVWDWGTIEWQPTLKWANKPKETT